MARMPRCAAIAAAGHAFGGYLPVSEAVMQLLNMAISFAGVTFCFALLYKAVPDAHIEWRDVWIGAAVTAALFSIGKFLIGLYIGKAGVASTYGAAGSLLWRGHFETREPPLGRRVVPSALKIASWSRRSPRFIKNEFRITKAPATRETTLNVPSPISVERRESSTMAPRMAGA